MFNFPAKDLSEYLSSFDFKPGTFVCVDEGIAFESPNEIVQVSDTGFYIKRRKDSDFFINFNDVHLYWKEGDKTNHDYTYGHNYKVKDIYYGPDPYVVVLVGENFIRSRPLLGNIDHV